MNGNASIAINAQVRASFAAPGRFDVTAWVAQPAAGDPRMYARATGGTGAGEYALELIVHI